VLIRVHGSCLYSSTGQSFCDGVLVPWHVNGSEETDPKTQETE
jgi:hypothetical protein